MTNILLAVDMDNTLIHSAKKRRDGDVCVEIYNGAEQSFMSKREIELLKSLPENITLLPVTTRSIEQYKRIEWTDVPTPRMALVTNGAILLDNGEADSVWSDEYKLYANGYVDEFASLYEKMSVNEDFIRCRMVDGMYLFACCETSVKADEYAAYYRNRTALTVQPSGRKLYFFPPDMNKGAAIKKYVKSCGCGMLICAGDSVIDYPMLEEADLALVPDADTIMRINVGNKECCGNGLFAEYILERAAREALMIR